MEKSFESRYAKVMFNEDSNAIVTVWKEQVTNDSYKETFREILKAIKKYEATALVSDISKQGKVCTTSRLWMQENILPEAIRCDVTQIATVVPGEDYERFSYDGEKQNIRILNRPVEFKYFRYMEDALQWTALEVVI